MNDANVSLPEPVARVWELDLRERERVLAKHGPVLVAPLYLHDQLRAYGDARERAARAAAFDEAIAAIKALPMGFADTIGPVICISVIEELRGSQEAKS